MNAIERLAILQAIHNAIGAELKTGVDGNLRAAIEGGVVAGLLGGDAS